MIRKIKSVPEEKTKGASRSRRWIFVKFLVFLLAFTAVSSTALIAFQMVSTKHVVAVSKAKGLERDVTSSPTSVLLNPTEDYDAGKNFLDEVTQASGAKGSLDNLSNTFTHHTTGDVSDSRWVKWSNRYSP